MIHLKKLLMFQKFDFPRSTVIFIIRYFSYVIGNIVYGLISSYSIHTVGAHVRLCGDFNIVLLEIN